jgi:hypothetical protein
LFDGDGNLQSIFSIFADNGGGPGSHVDSSSGGQGSHSAQEVLRRESADPPSFAAGLSIRALQFHLCIIYLNTSLAKMSGSQWWNGEAIWRALMEPQFAVFDVSWLAGVLWAATIVCWGVLLVEGGYPFLIWPRRTRLPWVVATVFLHVGIAVLMGLWLFGLLMVLLTLSAFGVEPIRALWLERRARREPGADPLPGPALPLEQACRRLFALAERAAPTKRVTPQ